MEEKKYLIKSKKQMFLVIGAFALILLLGTVSYAFFNYTRTGGANTLGTGKIKFTSNVGEASAISLANMFPITTSAYEGEALSSGVPVATVPQNARFGRYVVTLSGETTYAGGLDFRVTAQDVNLVATDGAAENPSTILLPINVVVYATDNANTTLGDTAITTNQYTTTALTNNAVLAYGHIGTTVESTTSPVVTFSGTRYQGTVTIDAYLDDSRILITDTPEENLALQAGKTVISTTQWNNLTNGTGSPISFKVRVESNEGTSAPAPVVPTIASCPGCKFMYTQNEYHYGTNGTLLTAVKDTVSDNYNDVISGTRTHFIGFTTTGTGASERIDRAFACGVKGPVVNSETVFCIEGTNDDSRKDAVYSSNRSNMLELYGEDCWDGNGGILCAVDYKYWSLPSTSGHAVVATFETYDYEDSACEVLGDTNTFNCYGLDYEGE